MTTAYAESTLQDLPDGPGLLTEAHDGQIMRWDAGQGRMVMVAMPRPSSVVLSGGGGGGGGSQAPHNHDGLYAPIGHTHEGGDDHNHDGVYALVGHNHAGVYSPVDHDHDDRYVMLADYTAADVLSKLLTVDGSGSGLDADTVDGQHASAFESAGAVATHAALTAAHGATGAVVGTTNEQTLTNKTLTTPTIASFTNAGHDHTNAAGGGQLGTGALTDAAVTNVKLANMVQATVKGRASGAGTGSPVDLSAAQVRTILNVADGANAYVHPNHSGDVTSVGDGATTITNAAVTNAKLANMAAATLKGRALGAGTGAPTDLDATALNAIVGSNDLTMGSTIQFSGASSAYLTSALATMYGSGSAGGSYPFTEAGNLIIQARSSAGALRDIVFATGGTTPTIAMAIDRTGRVGIGTPSPATPLDVNGNAQFTGTVVFQGAASAFPTGALNQIYASNGAGGSYPFTEAGNLVIQARSSAGALRDIVFATGGTTPGVAAIIDRNKRIGIGTTSPQGLLHGHDGTGGFGHFTKTGIVGSAQTIIPDGTGDVVRGVTVTGVARTTDGAFIRPLGPFVVANGGSAVVDLNPPAGTDTLTFAVAANGAFTVARSGGTKTYEISVWLTWL